jgi:hypothetical protein
MHLELIAVNVLASDCRETFSEPMRPERGEASVVAPLRREISGPQMKYIIQYCAARKPPQVPSREWTIVGNVSRRNLFHPMRLLSSLSCSMGAGSGFRAPQFVRMKSISYPGGAILASRKYGTHKIPDGETLCMLKYASVRFRSKQMRVAYRPALSRGWFADLTDPEGEKFYLTAREEAAIVWTNPRGW